ncbi:MAG: hypothetical protein ABJA78_15920 [Ferruginibacter sp.]
MIPTKILLSTCMILLPGLMMNSCKKNDTAVPAPPTTQEAIFKYPDSVLYLKNQSADNIVLPVSSSPGKYYGFPDGLQLDENTGAIDLNKSETGLRYRVTHVSPAGDSVSTLIVVSGISYTDQFYHISAGDSIANPIYLAAASQSVPLNGSLFDDGNGANTGGCSIKTDNGKINLAQSIRNGIFGSHPANDSRKDIEIAYRLNDKSDKSRNKLKIRLFYYATMADVSADLLQTLRDRQNDGVFINGRGTTTGRSQDHGKSRPPCVIIIAN